MFHSNQEQISDNAEEQQRNVLDQEYGRISLEQNHNFMDVKESMTEVPVSAKLKADNMKIPNEKFKGKSVVAGFKVDVVQLSAVNF